MRTPMLPRLAAALALAVGLAVAPARAEEAPVVAAAASMQFALEEIAADYRAATGRDLRLAFGSTGNLARQLRAGAPYQILLAADEETVLALHADGLTRDAGRVYAVGRLALVVPEGSPVAADGSLSDLRRALAAGEVEAFAIANPEHAPYGRRAEEALRHAGLWEAVGPHLVLGETVSQAAQFVSSGNAEAGLVSLALTLAPGMASGVRHAEIPADWHAPLTQRMVLAAAAGPAAEAFFAYLQTPAARAVILRHGYSLPDTP